MDYARQRPRVEGGRDAHPVSFDEALVVTRGRSGELVAIDDVLKALEKLDPRKGRIVELRFFGGLGVEETAEVLKISRITVIREWKRAKAWLHRELTQEESHGA